MSDEPNRNDRFEDVTVHPVGCKYRRQTTILSNEEGDEKYRKTDADLIMTAAALGFCKILLDKTHPVEFTSSKKNYPRLHEVVKKINLMLGTTGKGVTVAHEKYFKEGQRLHWQDRLEEKGMSKERVWNVITGAKGASEEDFDKRDKTPGKDLGDQAERNKTLDFLNKVLFTRPLTDEEKENAESAFPFSSKVKKEEEYLKDHRIFGEDLGYQSKGAYTGFVVYPDESRVSLTSTTEIDVETPERWIPTEKCTCGGGGMIHGHLHKYSKWWERVRKQKHNARLRRGEANTINEAKHHLVGYVHGMMQAIYMCEADGREGLVPFEIAVGEETKKLASCFTCTLFMYAAGYPPSAMHLDMGLSWVPHEHDPKGLWENRKLVPPKSAPSPDGWIELWEKPQKDKDDPSKNMDDAIKDTNAKWHKFCKRILAEGVRVLINNQGLVSKDVVKTDIWEQQDKRLFGDSDWWHKTRLPVLQSFCEKLDEANAGYLILDAVTIHDKESNRIDRTIAGSRGPRFAKQGLDPLLGRVVEDLR